MRQLAFLLLFWVLGLAQATVAQPSPASTIISAAPERVSVTVYRNPRRARSDTMNLNYLGGFALVTETRTLRLPKGPAVLRFEGVAEGIIPVSVIVDGLPGGTVEKNRDARLLSPASLVDGSLGRIVTLTRTDQATGQIRQEQATIVAGPSPGIVLKTRSGIETLRCSGLPETLHFPTMPDGLSAKPVLSVSTVTPSEQTVTVTLSYLASGFDWSASYVVNMAPDGRSLDLFAWLTLANSNPEPFADADVLAVAGRLNRSSMAEVQQRVSELRLTCYPLGTTTSDLRMTILSRDDILATGTASVNQLLATIPGFSSFNNLPPNYRGLPDPEDLGDLKLYRVPERVTVAPRGQKQVALLERSGIRFERRYRLAVEPGETITAAPAQIILRLHNVKEDGLGLALPAGTTTLYADRQGQRLLVGTGTVGDYAEGQRLRIDAGFSAQVLVDHTSTGEGSLELFRVAVTNANPFAVTVEVPVNVVVSQLEAISGTLSLVDGIPTWTVTLPANGRADFAYRFRSRED